MPTDTVQQFLEEGQRSGLLSATAAQEVLAQLTADEPLTLDEVAARMIEKDILTAYQAEQLLAGRGETCLVAGRYRVMEKLGEGGMGTVFKAWDTKLDRLVALKVLPARMVNDPGAVARFQREAKALAKVSHPAIVQAHDAGEDRGQHFLVMEYVQGSSLGEVVKDKGRIGPTLAADYIHQSAQGLQHAHDKGLVHRDLKPANLLRTPDGQIKILDLGLARFLQDQLGDAGLTREGMGMGTPDYMAPEQFHDARHVDARADIYALGCTLYHLLTGAAPFPGTSLAEKAEAHEKQAPPALEERCPDAPAGLTLVVQRMMAKRPADRFQSARELAEALTPYVASSSTHIPVIRNTASWQGSQLSFTLTRKKTKRRQTMLYGGIGGAAAMVAGGVFLILALSGAFSPALDEQPPGPGPQVNANDSKASPPAVIQDANVLTVSKDPKDGGQFRTLTDALEKVEPGMTIRVLDAGVYHEPLSITSPSQHKGITLESVRQATLEVRQQGAHAVTINGVPGVTVRGFRLRSAATKVTLLWIQGDVPGLLVDRLELEGEGYDGITMLGLNHGADQAPAVVNKCVLHRPQIGISVQGLDLQYRSPILCSRIVIRDSSINTPATFAINLAGDCRQVQIVGNRIWRGGRLSGMQMAMVQERCEDILIANNTFFECAPAFRLTDAGVKGKNIRLCNNLVLGSSQADMVFLNYADYYNLTGPGKGQLVGQQWRLDHNWRESKKPPGNDLLSQSWIPPGPEDELRDEIPVRSRNPLAADFLRPAKDSPLAGGGAGKGDPSLPPYVGAVPPEGVEPWDWEKTWKAMIRNKSQ